MAQSLSDRSRTLVVRLVEAVVGVRSGHVLVAHSSVIASMIAAMIASVIASVAWLSLSLAIVTMVITMKTLWAPVVVAGGMTIMTISISIAWVSVSLSLVIITSIITIVAIVTMGVARLSLSLAIVVIAMKALWTPVGVAVASVWMVGGSIAIARLGEGHSGQRENLEL